MRQRMMAELSDCDPSHPNCSVTIESCLRVFDHTNEQAHNNEIEQGADEVFCRLLLSLTSDESGQIGTKKRQKICHVCKIIEMIYRCSKDKAELSFQRVGPNLLDCLSVLLSHELERHGINHDQGRPFNLDAPPVPDVPQTSQENGTRRLPLDATIKSVTRIVSSFARVQSATTALAQHTRLVSLLACIVECSADTISFESQHNSLWILANLACERESSLLLISTHRRLLHALVRVAGDPGNMPKRCTRSVWSHSYQALQVQRTALRCILNLTYIERTADQIMRNSGPLLTSICQLITQNQSLLSLFHSGQILRSLAFAARNDGDVVFRRKAALTLANLVEVSVEEVQSSP